MTIWRLPRAGIKDIQRALTASSIDSLVTAAKIDTEGKYSRWRDILERSIGSLLYFLISVPGLQFFIYPVQRAFLSLLIMDRILLIGSAGYLFISHNFRLLGAALKNE